MFSILYLHLYNYNIPELLPCKCAWINTILADCKSSKADHAILFSLELKELSKALTKIIMFWVYITLCYVKLSRPNGKAVNYMIIIM